MQTKLELAIELCTKIYDHSSIFRVYPALTGGTLYKDGERKDIDIVLYGDSPEITLGTVANILNNVNVTIIKMYGRVTKCTYKGVDVDIILPSHVGEYYPEITSVPTL
jgi:hypothetical protein